MYPTFKFIKNLAKFIFCLQNTANFLQNVCPTAWPN